MEDSSLRSPARDGCLYCPNFTVDSTQNQHLVVFSFNSKEVIGWH